MKMAEYLEKVYKENLFEGVRLYEELVEMEALVKRLNMLYGVEIDISVREEKPQNGRWLKTHMLEKIIENRRNKLQK